MAMTPSRLWKTMTMDQRLRAARAFWLDEEGENDQMQAVLLIAQQKKFRAKSVIALDVDRRAKQFATLPSLPEVLAARALVTYHLVEQRGMMASFLDALGVPHENGLIKEDEVKPDPAKIPEAAARIGEQYPKADVSLYLNTLLCQDPDTWKALEDVPQVMDAGPGT